MIELYWILDHRVKTDVRLGLGKIRCMAQVLKSLYSLSQSIEVELAIQLYAIGT